MLAGLRLNAVQPRSDSYEVKVMATFGECPVGRRNLDKVGVKEIALAAESERGRLSIK